MRDSRRGPSALRDAVSLSFFFNLSSSSFFFFFRSTLRFSENLVSSSSSRRGFLFFFFLLYLSLVSFFSLAPLSFLFRPKTTSNRYELPSPPNVRAARTVADLEAAIAGTFYSDGDVNDDVNDEATTSANRLTVIEFFVPACPACRSLAPKLRQLAEDNPDVDFVTVNGEASPEMSAAVEALGVDRLPFFAFYRKGGERVSAFACNLRRVAVLRAELAAAKECVGECAAAE